jgi:prolipoprotein diacylglyceryltransferase
MGQTLSAPMIVVGLWFVLTSRVRRARVEPYTDHVGTA